MLETLHVGHGDTSVTAGRKMVWENTTHAEDSIKAFKNFGCIQDCRPKASNIVYKMYQDMEFDLNQNTP